MEFFDRISGKAVEEELEKFIEVYGEVLLGLHRDVTKLSRDLSDSGDCHIAQIELLREQIITTDSGLSEVKDRFERLDAMVAAEFERWRATIAACETETTVIAATRETLSRQSEMVQVRCDLVEGRLEVQARQIRLLQILFSTLCGAALLGVGTWFLQ